MDHTAELIQFSCELFTCCQIPRTGYLTRSLWQSGGSKEPLTLIKKALAHCCAFQRTGRLLTGRMGVRKFTGSGSQDSGAQ